MRTPSSSKKSWYRVYITFRLREVGIGRQFFWIGCNLQNLQMLLSTFSNQGSQTINCLKIQPSKVGQ